MESGGLPGWVSFLAMQSLWWAAGIFFVAALVEMWFPPFPGDSIFFLGLVSLQAGGRPVWGAILASSLGAFAGFALLYWLGMAKGRAVIQKRTSGLFSPSGLPKVESWFRRWGVIVIVFGRFLAGVRSAVPLAAGVGAYPLAPTMFLGMLSILIWNALLAYLALLLHQNWTAVGFYWRTYNTAIWIILVAGLVVLAVRYWLRRRSTRKA
ncbi:MAG: DedA family protein [candidate division Zixibacteria bacterium]|nr:DedA family protein [candidate division Zixibacteria bacterium]